VESKPEVPDKIKEYVRDTQTKFEKMIKKMRSGRGGDYLATCVSLLNDRPWSRLHNV
jgi:hypothetical protein